MNGWKFPLGLMALAAVSGIAGAYDTAWYSNAVINDGASLYWNFNSQDGTTGAVSEMVGGNAADAMLPYESVDNTTYQAHPAGWLVANNWYGGANNLGNAFATYNGTNPKPTYRVEDSSKTSQPTSYAIEFWALRSSATSKYLMVAPGAANTAFYEGWNGPGVMAVTGNGGPVATFTPVTTTSVWHQYVVVADAAANTTTTIIDNGTPIVTTGALGPLSWDTTLVLGSSSSFANGTAWRNRIDELAMYDLTGKTSEQISALTDELKYHYALSFAMGPAQLTVTPQGEVPNGTEIAVVPTAGYDAAKVSNLTLTQGLNGAWNLTGDLANGRVAAGSAMRSTADLTGTANLLNGASVNGSVTMTVDGYDIPGATGGGDFVYTLAGSVSGNVAQLGVAQTANVAASGSLAGLASETARAGEALGSAATLAAGISTTGGAVTETWAVRSAEDLVKGVVSDVLNLSTPTTSNNGSFLLSMSYNDEDVGSAPESSLLLSSFSGEKWLNAVASNIGIGSQVFADYAGSAAAFMAEYGVTDSNLADFLGSWGRDTEGNTVWAVVNHNSEFAVVSGTIPEPGAITLLFTGVIGLLAYAWRRRR